MKLVVRIELDVDHAKKINLEADGDDVQKHWIPNIGRWQWRELIEMHERRATLKKSESLDAVQSESVKVGI
ncbi:hypothetical protein TNCV_1924541 [Trichonephila clavipes]|nr:hypothetical protein TNCV_1924541 [Trichonephila clavipes]